MVENRVIIIVWWVSEVIGGFGKIYLKKEGMEELFR